MRRKLNKYRFIDDYVVGICADGTEFKIDKDDYARVSCYTWRYRRGQIEGCINRKNVQLSRFILNIPQNNKKVYLREPLDFRKQNLFYGNRYTFYENYCAVECFDGTQFMIDLDDYNIVSCYTWHCNNGYIVGKVNKKEIKIHRFLLNAQEGQEIDHINRNPLDNKRDNLRIISRSGNCVNRGKCSNNTSGRTGVYRVSGYDRYAAQLNIDGKRIYLGSYDTYEDACRIRELAEQKYCKDYLLL